MERKLWQPMPPEQITLEMIGEKVSKVADSFTENQKKLDELSTKVETNNRDFADFKSKFAKSPDGGFNIRTEAGKLDPEDPKHVKEHFSIPRMVSAMYRDQVENRHDKAWELVPGKNGATFERDVLEIARGRRAAMLRDADPGALRAMADIRANAEAKSGQEGYRAQTTDVGSQGGYLVPAELGWYDEVLRNALVISAAGVANVPASTIPFYFNQKTTASTGAYLSSETATLNTGSIVFSQKALYPRVYGYYVPVSRRALRTASPDLAGIVRDDLMADAALNRQKQLLKGTGLSGAPVGIDNAASGVNTTTQASTSASTLASAVSTVDKANGITNPDKVAWIVAPGFKAKVASLFNANGQYPIFQSANSPWVRTAIPIWGFPMLGTAALTSGATTSEGIFGDWSMVSMVDWSQELIFSEHVLWTSQQVVLGILDEHEIAIRRTASFTYFTDGVGI